MERQVDQVGIDIRTLPPGAVPLKPSEVFSQVLFFQCLEIIRSIPHGNAVPVVIRADEGDDDSEDWKPAKPRDEIKPNIPDRGQNETLKAAHAFLAEYIHKTKETIREWEEKEADRAVRGSSVVASGSCGTPYATGGGTRFSGGHGGESGSGVGDHEG